MESQYIKRVASKNLLEAMQDTPVIFLAGPRQTGKTTLVRKLAQEQGMDYYTMDNETTLLSAQKDATGFIQSINKAVIDEIQRAPELLIAIKKAVDEDRRAGRFLLTGSANIMAIPKVADSLAGRMETLRLYPFSQSELHQQTANWVDAIFAGDILTNQRPATGDELIELVLTGGYPEMRSRTTARRRSAWATQYIDALVQRDVRDIADITKLEYLPKLLQMLGHYAGQMCNFSQLGAELGLNHKTVASYTQVFEQMFLLKTIPAWAKTDIKRVVKTPKIQFLDSGLLANLIGMTAQQIQRDRTRFGHVLETFVYGELLKHSSTAEQHCSILYYRDTSKNEVDFILESPQGEMIGIEVKAAASVQHADLKGLNKFAELAGSKFKQGIVFYTGKETLPLGNNIWAVPVASLWGS